MDLLGLWNSLRNMCCRVILDKPSITAAQMNSFEYRVTMLLTQCANMESLTWVLGESWVLLSSCGKYLVILRSTPVCCFKTATWVDWDTWVSPQSFPHGERRISDLPQTPVWDSLSAHSVKWSSGKRDLSRNFGAPVWCLLLCYKTIGSPKRCLTLLFNLWWSCIQLDNLI